MARLAGLPEQVVERAREILRELEQGSTDAEGLPRLARTSGGSKGGPIQLALFRQPERQLRQYLDGLELERLTPLEALNELAKLREMARGGV